MSTISEPSSFTPPPRVGELEHGRNQPMRRQRSAKIVATLGPASASRKCIGALFEAGVDVFRLNFSHGTHDDHRRLFEHIRNIEDESGRPIGILADMQGPKLRLGDFADGRVELGAGAHFRLDLENTRGDQTRAPLPHPEIFAAIEPGTELLVDDGKVRLRVLECGTDFAKTECLVGGTLSNHKGVNVPNVVLPISAITEKDRADISFALQQGADWIAFSFVQRPEDVAEGRKLIGNAAGLMVKLEKPAAIRRLEEIIELSDALMVARGDLGVEMPPEKVPVIQKHVIRRAAEWRKPVIIATQMLESMIENPRPTRAEASDVANAIFDGTDAVMLSAETASGRYPREAVCMMAKIVVEAESNMGDFMQPRRRREHHGLSISETICESVAHAAEDLDIAAIAVFTDTGNTARMLSKHRPKSRIYAFTHVPAVCNRMNLLWGVQPVRREHALRAEEMLPVAEKELLQSGSLKVGDVLGVVAGTQMSTGSTNFMRLHRVKGRG